jgi:sugar/nucleoside kinase (ribokinase family)
MKNYDIFSFGHISIGIVRTPTGEQAIPRGPILFAAWTAHQLGCSLGVMTKTSSKDRVYLKEFPIAEEDLYWIESSQTTTNAIDQQMQTKEKRVIINLAQADPYRIEDFPDISPKVIQYCGLLKGEIDHEIIRFVSSKAPMAIDVQGLAKRASLNGPHEFVNWDDKLDLLPFITYFKADAEEAAFLTGMNTEDHEGRVSAAKKLLEWGAKEVVISHNQELISATESGVASTPFKNRNLSGRMGRGDTCFTTYIAERFTKNPADATKYAAALTSLKMETPGFFKKTRQDVEAYMREFY